MTDWLIELDHKIVLGLNAMHTPLWDSIMLFLSSKTVWIPLYVVLAVLMFIPKWYGRRSAAFRYGSRIPLWLTGLTGVMAALLCFGLSDQLCNVVKFSVERLRPSHDPLLEGLLHLPEGVGGNFGFYSAHASNVFCLAVITALIFKRGWYSAAILLWAALISLSRIYLAKHFLTDVLCGAAAGAIIAIAVYLLYRWVLVLISKKYS